MLNCSLKSEWHESSKVEVVWRRIWITDGTSILLFQLTGSYKIAQVFHLFSFDNFKPENLKSGKREQAKKLLHKFLISRFTSESCMQMKQHQEQHSGPVQFY